MAFLPAITLAVVTVGSDGGATSNSEIDSPSPTTVDINTTQDAGVDLLEDGVDINNVPVSDGQSDIYNDIENDVWSDSFNFTNSLDDVNAMNLNLRQNCTNLVCHLKNVASILEGLILIVISLSVLVFLWGLIKYAKSVDDKTRAEAIGTITYGILALFVMISVWGLVNLLTSSFGFSDSMNSLKSGNINPTNLIRKN